MDDNPWRAVLDWGPDQIKDLRNLAFSFLQQGHYKKAAIYLEGLLLLDPQNPYDLKTLGAIYLQLNDNVKALEFLDAALAISPMDEIAQLNKAKALYILGRKAEAQTIAQNLSQSQKSGIASTAEALVLAHP
jgi:predicted Zn-dependent protease